MPVYHRLGKIPPKRHTQFEKPNGELYYEQLFGTIGFDGMSSLLYHIHRPTMIESIADAIDVSPKVAVKHNITSRMLRGFDVPPVDDYLEARKPMMTNSDVTIYVASPRKSLRDYFYKNADADELIFVHKGTGTLRTFVGNIPFDASEEALRQIFALGISGGDECIINVRLIRDKAKNVGKGFVITLYFICAV